MFDDYGNIASVNKWQSGGQGFWLTLLPNPDSVVYSRPLSMGTFMVSAWLGHGGPFAYKVGNLLVHLACGGMVFILLRRVLSEDRTLSTHAQLAAGFLAAVWLLHPLHASTVLYVVQRMAQLSTLFTLLAVVAYLAGRSRLISGQLKSATGLLFVAFPLLLLAGLLSKQNAAIAPVLCLVFELAYFGGQRGHRRTVLAFFALFALLPLLAASALLLMAPHSLLGGYGDWDFTLRERLLTQPRALLDYMAMTFVPNGPRMGIYADDFPISRGLFDPPSTALSIAVLVAITVAATALRKRAPSVFAGWWFFLVAHSVESSFLPLEMYYEHRNYLPSVGLLLAAAGLFPLASGWLVYRNQRLPRLGALLAVSILTVLAFATLGRALVWQDEETIVSQAMHYHPNSMRAMLDQGVEHIQRKEYEKAISVTAPLRNSRKRRELVIGNLQSLTVQCMRGRNVDTTSMQRAVDAALPRVTVFELQMARLLLLATPTGRCGEHSTHFIGEGLEKILMAAPGQTDPASAKDAMRTIVSQLYARAGDWRAAEQQASIAWANRTYLPAGALLVRMYVHNHKRDQALAALRQLDAKARPFDTVSQDQLAMLRSLINERLSGGNAGASSEGEGENAEQTSR